jgi:hypothetical protein
MNSFGNKHSLVQSMQTFSNINLPTILSFIELVQTGSIFHITMKIYIFAAHFLAHSLLSVWSDTLEMGKNWKGGKRIFGTERQKRDQGDRIGRLGDFFVSPVALRHKNKGDWVII